jgi:thiol:disulfide interchange protein DsbD
MANILRNLTLLSVWIGLSSFFNPYMSWKAQPSVEKAKAKVGDVIELVFSADIENGWYFYSNDFDAKLGPMIAVFSFEPHASYELIGTPTPVGNKRKHDKVWDGEISFFTKKAEFRQKVRIKQSNFVIKATLRGQVCSDETGKCVLVREMFSF